MQFQPGFVLGEGRRAAGWSGLGGSAGGLRTEPKIESNLIILLEKFASCGQSEQCETLFLLNRFLRSAISAP